MRQTAVKNSQRQNRLSVNRHVSMTVKGYGSGRRFLCFSYGHRQFNILDPLFFPCIRQRDLQHGVSGRQIASEVPLKPGISGGNHSALKHSPVHDKLNQPDGFSIFFRQMDADPELSRIRKESGAFRLDQEGIGFDSLPVNPQIIKPECPVEINPQGKTQGCPRPFDSRKRVGKLLKSILGRRFGKWNDTFIFEGVSTGTRIRIESLHETVAPRRNRTGGMPYPPALDADNHLVFITGKNFIRQPNEGILCPVNLSGAVHAQSGVAVVSLPVRITESGAEFDFRCRRIFKTGSIDQFLSLLLLPAENAFRRRK